MGKHDPRIDARTAGEAWSGLRDQLAHVQRLLLGVAPSASSELTTVYAKYKLDAGPMSPVFAVLWLRSSQNVWLGLALPDKPPDPATYPAPPAMKYKGLTTYFPLVPDRDLPSDLGTWIQEAYDNVRRQTTRQEAA